MKKKILLFVLLFTNLMLQAQSGTVTMVPDSNVYSNTSFNLGLSISCSGCTNFTINLNIGNFSYNPITGTTYPAGISVPQASGTTGSISVVVNNNCQANQYISIPLKANAVCQPLTGTQQFQDISATITSCSGMTVTNSNQAVRITPINQLPTVQVFNTGSTPYVCRGARVNTYKVRVQNPIAGWTINSPALGFELPSCASQVSSSVNGFTTSTNGAVQTVLSQLANLTPGATNDIFISFTLPCTSCNTFPLVVTPKAILSGVRCNYTPSAQLTTTTGTVVTFTGADTEICFSDCTSSSGATIPDINLTYGPYNPFHCPDGTDLEGSYDLSVDSGLSISNIRLTTNIPTQATIHTVQMQILPVGNLSCAASTQLFCTTVQNPTIVQLLPSVVINNVITITAPAGQKIDKLIWDFSNACTLVAGTTVKFNYTYTYLPDAILPPVDGSGNPLQYGGFDCNANITGTQHVTGTSDIIFDHDRYYYVNNSNNLLANCLGILMNHKVRLKSTTTDFVPTISVMPSAEVSYLIAVKANNIQNLVLRDILPLNLVPSSVANFKYAYGTATNEDNPANTPGLVFTSLPIAGGPITGTGLLSPIPQFSFTQINNTINIADINFPANAQTLYITFDAQLSSSLMYNSGAVSTRFRISQGNQSAYSDFARVSVTSVQSVDTKIHARCILPTLGEWQDDVLAIRDTDKVDFRINVKNTGSVPLSLKEVQNLKPMPLDKFVDAPGISRGSTFKVDYLCNVNPTVETSFTTSAVCEISYSNTGPDKQRETVCPVQITGVASVWSTTSCTQSLSNWIKFSYGSTGLTINPGEEVNFIFRGQVSGASTTNFTSDFAINSFGVKLNYNNSFCPSPIEDTVKLSNDGEGCDPPCINCASFALSKKEKYFVSGWVKEENKNEPYKQYKTYAKSFIRLTFFDDSGNLINTPSPLTYFPSGAIIDGWQRIVGEFIVPMSFSGLVGNMRFELVNGNSSVISYFDDIRILPSKANMKSYVYDQKTQQLMAELDENNYSTFYEYDIEGDLTRVKKETEKGVFTTQETRSGNTKIVKP